MPVKTEELYSSFIKFLNAAIKRLSMYPPEHPSSQQAVNRPFEVLCKILDQEGQAILSLIDNKLVLNGAAVEESLNRSYSISCRNSDPAVSIDIVRRDRQPC